jgi:GT2 family glycosyltransferase
MNELGNPTSTAILERRAFDRHNPAECMVSVIIPAFNSASTILRAIESVRNQSIASFEIIVIDDGSTDATSAVVSSNIRPGEPIRLIQLPKNCGVSAARNAGIRHAKGKYLSFLDADDIWLPEKLEKQIEVIEADPAVTLVSCNSLLVSEAGLRLKEGHVNRPPVEGPDAWKTLLIYNFIPTPTVLTYRSLVQEIGGFDEALAVGEDLDLWIKLAIRGKIRVLPEVLINYYDSTGSLMKRHSRDSRIIVVPMLEKHITEQRSKLLTTEIRQIRGQQSFQIGCNLFFSGSYLQSIPLFLRSFSYGCRPVKSLTYLPRAVLMACLKKLRGK